MSDNVVSGSTHNDEIERREKAEIRPLRAENAALELEVLRLRDWAATHNVVVGDLRKRLELAVVDNTNHRAHIARLETALGEALKRAGQVEPLRRELAAVYASSTWRVGRAVLAPVRVVKRLLRRG